MGMAGGILAAATGNVNIEGAGPNGSVAHSANMNPASSSALASASSSHHAQGASASAQPPSDHQSGANDELGEDDFIQEETDEVPCPREAQSQSQYQMKIEPSSKSYSKAKPIGKWILARVAN